MNINRTLGFQRILAHRAHQISVEGFTEANDDAYKRGELATAAYGYEWSADVWRKFNSAPKEPPLDWPWDPSWFKSKGFCQDLIKAGALYMAEAGRAERAGETGAQKMAQSLVRHISGILDYNIERDQDKE